MFSTLKESTVWTFLIFLRFFQAAWFGIVALYDWLIGFALVQKWFFGFLLPKVIVILIGMIVTPFPLWLLVIISFIPLPLIAPLYFIIFVLMFSHFNS